MKRKTNGEKKKASATLQRFVMPIKGNGRELTRQPLKKFGIFPETVFKHFYQTVSGKMLLIHATFNHQLPLLLYTAKGGNSVIKRVLRRGALRHDPINNRLTPVNGGVVTTRIVNRQQRIIIPPSVHEIVH